MNSGSDVILENGFIIRKFQPQDAVRVTECIRDAYGESYVKPLLYDENEVLRLDREGKMRFSIALAPNGDAAGITAFERENDFRGLAEIACQVVREKYSGHGLAIELALHAMQMAEKESFSGQFARALGCHLMSQKTLKRMGFTPCGFLLNVFDKKLFLHRFPNGNYAKIPQSVAVKAQKKRSAGRIWLPEKLHALGKAVYSEMNISAEIYSGEQAAENNSVLEPVQDSRHNTMTIWVRKTGADISEILFDAVNSVRQNEGQSVNLYINISEKGCGEGYFAAEKLGFIFTGFLPCCEDGEYMIMHNPLRLEIFPDDMPHISEYEPFIEEIRRQLCERK